MTDLNDTERRIVKMLEADVVQWEQMQTVPWWRIFRAAWKDPRRKGLANIWGLVKMASLGRGIVRASLENQIAAIRNGEHMGPEYD